MNMCGSAYFRANFLARALHIDGIQSPWPFSNGQHSDQLAQEVCHGCC